MADKVQLTKDGLLELEKELEDRKTVIRTEIADEIDKARQQGDLSENAAYKAALEKKEFNDTRIAKLEEMLVNVEIISTSGKSGKIGLGSKVEIENKSTGSKSVYTLVGHNEANPAEGRISSDSPIGVALMDKSKGDTVKVNLPSGEVLYEIKSIA